MPTLAELRAMSGPQPLPRATKVVTLVEGQHLLAEMENIDEERTALTVEKTRLRARASGEADGERTGPPRKAGEGSQVAGRIAEIDARLAVLKDRSGEIVDDLAEVQGEIGLRGITGGEWQRFKDENPPREDNAQDARYAGSNCNSAVLFADLGRFVATWDGEDVTASDWAGWLAERITYADRRDMVAVVVRMHEDGLARSPKFQSGSALTSRSASV